MKLRDAGNLRAFFLILYLLFSLLFTALFLVAGRSFRISIADALDKNERTSALLAALRSALADARLAAETQFAGVLSASEPSETPTPLVRASLRLREAADRLSPVAYGRTADFRQALRTVARAADQIHREKTASEVFALFAESEKQLAFLEARQGEETVRLAGRLQRSYWLLAAVLFLFFLFSFLFVFAAFVLLGRVLKASLQSLSGGTREFRNGNMEYRFRDITPDEIGQAKYDFNIMAHRISAQSRSLQAANEELRSQAEKLIAAHQHKDRFLSNMSHELRTPLSAIIGFSELLSARAEKLTPEKIRSHAARIQTAAEHLFGLIVSLLDLAKSGAGVLKPVFADFDMAAAVREAAAFLIPQAEKKSLTVRLELPDSLMVHADQRMIKQIFLNLFGNAIKYTPAGSVTVTLKAGDGSVLLAVADTGIGIPESEHKNLFTDFYRVDNGPGFLADGVGIGLALSRRLAALHRGEITFTSEKGKGSTFYFRMPCLQE